MGSNEIWQVAGNYGKWQQGMGCKVKSKKKRKYYRCYEYMGIGKHALQESVVCNKIQPFLLVVFQ